MNRVGRGWRLLLRSRWGRSLLLTLACAVPAGVEAGVVYYAGGLRQTVYISPQASALWPYDTFHDLRWVMVYHRSWAGFVWESAAAILARGLFCTLLTALAWPAQVPRPPLLRLATRNLVFAAALGAFLSPWAAMSVVLADVSLSWYLLGEIAPVLIMAPFLLRGALVPGWWRGLPSAGIVALSLLNFVTITASSALVAFVPAGARVPVATLLGGANGLLWERAVRIAAVHRPAHWRRVPVMPIVVAAVVGLMFAIGTVSEVGLEKRPRDEPPALAAIEARAMHQPVIFLAGYDSRYEGQPSGSTLPVLRYSYSGLYPDGRPRPYTAATTHQSLVTSARLLAQQIDQVHHATGQKVALLAESEGTLITRYYLTMMPHPAVDTVALLSPILRAGRTYFPPPHLHAGWGVATGWELRAIFTVLGVASRLPNSVDEPFIRSLLDNAPLFRGKQMLCPVTGVRMIAFVPTLDAAANPPGLHADIPVVNVVGLHGLLIDKPLAQQRLVTFLNQGQPQPRQRWDYTAIQNAGAAWQAPALKVQLNPVWKTVAGKSTHDYGAACFVR